jgi:hypothetical protein
VQLLVEPDQNADGSPGGVFFKPFILFSMGWTK